MQRSTPLVGHRQFTDEQGNVWQVWEVRPHRTDRRLGDRRLRDAPVAGAERRQHEDRREDADRRKSMERRLSVDPELAGGWLAFHSALEKRRLAPIPDGWTALPASALHKLLKDAKVVEGSPPTIEQTGSALLRALRSLTPDERPEDSA